MYTYNKYCTRKSEAIKKPLNGKTKAPRERILKIYIYKGVRWLPNKPTTAAALSMYTGHCITVCNCLNKNYGFHFQMPSMHQHLPVCSNEQCSYTSLKNFDRSCSITSSYSDQHNLVYLLAKLRSFEQGKGHNVVNCNVTRLRNCRGFTNSYTKPTCLRSRASL